MVKVVSGYFCPLFPVACSACWFVYLVVCEDVFEFVVGFESAVVAFGKEVV